MIDKLNGRRMKMASTGSGRRQNYRFAPTSRMTNHLLLKVQTRDEISLTRSMVFMLKYGAVQLTGTGDFNLPLMKDILFVMENC